MGARSGHLWCVVARAEPIRDNDQVFLVLKGRNQDAAHTTRMNNFGDSVEEFVTDYQMSHQGGNAYMRVCELDLGANKIKSLSFSPRVSEKRFNTINQFDAAVLSDGQKDFAVDFKFTQRFSSFNPAFAAAPPNRQEPLVEAVRGVLASVRYTATWASPAAM